MLHFFVVIALLSLAAALLNRFCFVGMAAKSASFAIANYATLVDKKHGVITADSVEQQSGSLRWKQRRLAGFLSQQLRTCQLGHKLYTIPGDLILASRASGFGDPPVIVDTTRHIYGVNLTELRAYEDKYIGRVL